MRNNATDALLTDAKSNLDDLGGSLPTDIVTAKATAALAQATIALAYEQRTANLITLLAHHESMGVNEHAAELFDQISARIGLGGAA